MEKISSQDKLNVLGILDQAIEVANQIVKRLDIPAGSYTAEELHKAIALKSGKPHNRGVHDGIFTKAFDNNEKYNIRYSYVHKLQSEETKMMIPTRDVFKNIVAFEKAAGIKKKDRHVWVKDSPNTKVCSTVVYFPVKQDARGIATIMGSVNKPYSECMVYMPKEKKVLGICNNEYIYYNHSCKAESEVNLPDVAFKFRATTMKQIYGRCTVDYYIDTKGAYSIVITNEEGWKTGLNGRLSEYEMQSVYRMIKVQETDVPIFSGYHSERYMNDAEVKPKKQHQEKATFDKDILKEIVYGPDEDIKSEPVVTRNEPAPTLDDIIKDAKEGEEVAPKERQPVIDINDVVDEILNDSETAPTVNQKESTVNDTPSIAVNGAIKSVENSTTDNSRELKVKHPQSRVGVKRGVNKRLLLKSKDRHAKHHKYNKKINR